MAKTDLIIFDCDGVLIDSELISARMLIAELREQAELEDMRVLQKGNRLSITPVNKDEWRCITALLGR